MMEKEVEISVVYTDKFSEQYRVDEQTFFEIIREVKNEDQSDFHIGDKTFIKKEVAVVATPSYSIQFF